MVPTFLGIATRLRQVTTHPYLLEKMMRDSFELSDIQWLKEELSKLKSTSPFVEQIGQWCEVALENNETTGAFRKQPLGNSSFGAGDFGLEFDMGPQLKNLEAEKSVPCPICRNAIKEPEKLSVS